jgi:GT2 family glycosyltransferase
MRGTVAVICPFSGSVDEGARTAERLSRIARRQGDQLVLVDNTPEGVLSRLSLALAEVEVVRAPLEQSSYYARNLGAECTSSEWLLFIDADCLPQPSILDDYFAEPIRDDCGLVAGAIAGLSSQEGLLARHARARGVLDQRRLAHQDRPFGATANLLVRKAAWADVGGFVEGIRSGGDVDLCWRVQEAGWKLVYRDGARVEHIHREQLLPLLRQYLRYGAGRAWLERRYPSVPRASRHLRLLVAAPALIVGNLLRGRREYAAYRALDEAIVIGGLLGRFFENRSSGRIALRTTVDTAIITDVFPAGESLSLVERLEGQGQRVWVLATHRSLRTPASSMRRLDVTYLEDEGLARRLSSLARYAAKRPFDAVRQALTSRGKELADTALLDRRLASREVRDVRFMGDDTTAAPGVETDEAG